MIELILENYDNDKRLPFQLPIVPRIGDWICIDHEDEFTEGENPMIVKYVLLSQNEIIIVVTAND